MPHTQDRQAEITGGKKEYQMTTGEWITLIAVFVIAGVCLFLGIRSFLERGFLLNNAYFYASKEERETMDKRPYHRQSAIIFSVLCVAFLVSGLALVFKNDKLFLLEIPLFAGVIVYAIISTIMINRKKR